MAVDQFQENVRELARKMRRSYELLEGEIPVKDFKFEGAGLEPLPIPRTDKNRATRLWVEFQAQDQSFITITSELLVEAERYFAQHWKDEPGTGKHPFLDGLRKYSRITL